jgi:hypothetical protein
MGRPPARGRGFEVREVIFWLFLRCWCGRGLRVHAASLQRPRSRRVFLFCAFLLARRVYCVCRCRLRTIRLANHARPSLSGRHLRPATKTKGSPSASRRDDVRRVAPPRTSRSRDRYARVWPPARLDAQARRHAVPQRRQKLGRSLRRRAKRAMARLKSLLFPSLEFKVVTAALNAEQVREFRLPSTPLKETGAAPTAGEKSMTASNRRRSTVWRSYAPMSSTHREGRARPLPRPRAHRLGSLCRTGQG